MFLFIVIKYNFQWFYIPAIITRQRMTGSAFKGGGLCRVIRESEFTWPEPEFSAENQQEILLESDKRKCQPAIRPESDIFQPEA